MKPSTWAALAVLTGIVGWKIYTQPAQRTHRFAPEGTYFVTEYVSFPTEHGMTGVEPGESVRLLTVLDANAGWLHVASRNGEFDIKSDKLTNDIDLAEAIRQRDQDGQADLLQETAASQQRQADQQGAYADARAKAVQQTSVAMAASSTVGGYQSHLHDPATPGGVTYNNYTYYSSGGGGGTVGGGGAGAAANSGHATGGGPAPAGAGQAPAANSARERYTQDVQTRQRMQSGGNPPISGQSTWR